MIATIRDPWYTSVYHIIVKEGTCPACGKTRTSRHSDRGCIGDFAQDDWVPCESCGKGMWMRFIGREKTKEV